MRRITTELVSELRSLYDHFTNDPGFPVDHCTRASTLIGYHYGLYVVVGEFILGGGNVSGHYWNEDGNGVKIDLTASQFNGWLPEKIQPGVLVLYPGDSLNGRYRQYSHIRSKYLIRPFDV